MAVAVKMGDAVAIGTAAVDEGALDGDPVLTEAEVADDEVTPSEFFTPDSISMTESRVLAGGVVIICAATGVSMEEEMLAETGTSETGISVMKGTLTVEASAELISCSFMFSLPVSWEEEALTISPIQGYTGGTYTSHKV